MSATQAARIRNLRATLAAIAGGKPAAQLDPETARRNLELVQRSAELCLAEDDDAEEAGR